MDVLKITGGRALRGSVKIGCAKNAVLPILAAAMLTGGTVKLRNCPHLGDIENMLAILAQLGCAVRPVEDAVAINASTAATCILICQVWARRKM